MSRCPLVTGSNDPGQTARRTGPPRAGSGDGLGRSGGRRERTRARSRRTSCSRLAAEARRGQAGSAPREPRSTTTMRARAPASPGRRSAARSAATSSSGMGVRRVEEHHVVRRRRRPGAARRRPGRRRTSTRGKPRSRALARDQRGGTPVLLDQRDHPGPARPGLEADRAGAGVQVEEAQPVQRAAPRLDGGEQRLAHPVAGRAGCWRPRGVAIRRPPAVPPMIRVMASGPGTRARS